MTFAARSIFGAGDIPYTGVAATTSDTGGKAVDADCIDNSFGPAGASCTSQLWAETDASGAYVRLDIASKSGISQTLNWYNTAGAAQGDPGVDQNAAVILLRPDSLKIRLVSSTGTITKIGSFTDNVEFTPTNGVNYGYQAPAVAEVPPGVFDSDTRNMTVEFTFIKAGHTDLVLTYYGEAYAEANDDS